jgi:hypothetical protein
LENRSRIYTELETFRCYRFLDDRSIVHTALESRRRVLFFKENKGFFLDRKIKKNMLFRSRISSRYFTTVLWRTGGNVLLYLRRGKSSSVL